MATLLSSLSGLCYCHGRLSLNIRTRPLLLLGGNLGRHRLLPLALRWLGGTPVIIGTPPRFFVRAIADDQTGTDKLSSKKSAAQDQLPIETHQ